MQQQQYLDVNVLTFTKFINYFHLLQLQESNLNFWNQKKVNNNYVVAIR